MYRGARVGVVVPAYNEEGFVGDVIDGLPSFVDRAYVVDDGSTDGTWAEIQRHADRAEAGRPRAVVADGGAAFEPRVVTIRHDENRGVGGAIKTGYRRARRDRLDVVAVMNADGQMDPDVLDRILDPVVEGEAGFAKGNRLLDPALSRGMSAWRLFGNLSLTLLTKVASGYWGMMDPQNGYTAISAETLDAVDLDRLYDGYGFCNDLLVALNVADVRIADVPMRARYGAETSHIRYVPFVSRVSRLLVRGFCWRMRTKYLLAGAHPVALGYLVGAVLVAAGVGWLLAPADAPALGTTRGAVAPVLWLLGGSLVAGAMTMDRRSNADLQFTATDSRRDDAA